MDEELKNKMEQELQSVMVVRQSLDSILKDFDKYIQIVVSLDRRLTDIERKVDNLMSEKESKMVGMYG